MASHVSFIVFAIYSCLPLLLATTVLLQCKGKEKKAKSNAAVAATAKPAREENPVMEEMKKIEEKKEEEAKKDEEGKKPEEKKDKSSHQKSVEEKKSQRSEKDKVETNKKGEKRVTIEPKELRWSEEGGTQKLVLLNDSGERQAMKVKCSDNALFHFNPVFAFVEAGAKLEVQIIRSKAAIKVDKVVLLTIQAPADATDATLLFKATTATPTTFTIPMIAC